MRGNLTILHDVVPRQKTLSPQHLSLFLCAHLGREMALGDNGEATKKHAHDFWHYGLSVLRTYNAIALIVPLARVNVTSLWGQVCFWPRNQVIPFCVWLCKKLVKSEEIRPAQGKIKGFIYGTALSFVGEGNCNSTENNWVWTQSGMSNNQRINIFLFILGSPEILCKIKQDKVQARSQLTGLGKGVFALNL